VTGARAPATPGLPFKSFDHLVTAVRDLDGRLSLTYYEAYW
jgi:hypothetical protein